MKKQFFALAALLSVASMVSAQTEKGTQNLGLNAAYSNVSTTNFVANPGSGGIQNQTVKTNNFSIGPSYSVFVAKNLDAGLDLAYNNTTQDNTTTAFPYTHISKGYGGSLYLRKYYLYNNKLGFRTGGQVGYVHTNNKYAYVNTTLSAYNTETNANTVFGGLTLDLVYYPSKKIGVAVMLADATYQHQKNDNGAQGSGTVNTFAIDLVNNDLGLSVFFVFGGK